jgi:hypothetical protein
MHDDVRTVLEAILTGAKNRPPLAGVDLTGLGSGDIAVSLAAFARNLTGVGAADGSGGSDGTAGPGDGSLGGLLAAGAARVRAELEELYAEDEPFRAAVSRAAADIRDGRITAWDARAREAMWPVFFPEGAGLMGRTTEAVEALRARRRVEVTELNPAPIGDPLRELLVTSNVLLTVPHTAAEIEELPYGEAMKQRIREAAAQEQRYFYDHPIHIGTPPQHNEAIYGLRGLDEAVAWEKNRGAADPDGRLTVVLSLSVTHDGLHEVGPDYLREEISRAGGFEHLDVYLFSEVTCRRIVDGVLGPFIGPDAREAVAEVFGVDGEYGRHYSFLKAIAAFWQVFVDSRTRATFKIDLDQVFPQTELLEQTGRSAFGHFTTPLWGARGVDTEGNEVDLGMIAGALVNEKDIGGGVFTPDVPLPEEIPGGEATVFYNKLPMAVSTRAEMMARSEGTRRCLQRVHVTGGTNGILVEHLRRYRPFTPTFVGRAEDQAYLLSVLFAGNEQGRLLRYVHEPGLIMRHDKEAFAGASIAAAEAGRFVGDLVRTYYFTRYAQQLPWGMDRTKRQVDPFTGCFVTTRCYTVIMLRLVLRAAADVAAGRPDAAATLLDIAGRRLAPLLRDPEGTEVAERYRRERDAWQRYYEALDRAEHAGGDEAVLRQVREAARISA